MVSVLNQMSSFPKHFWEAAASSEKFQVKVIDTVGSISKLAVKCLPGNVVVQTVSNVGDWAKPISKIYKPFTDVIDPAKLLLSEGGSICAQPDQAQYSYIKLVARIALVAGLALAIPIYLESIGVMSLGTYLATNISYTAQEYTIMELSRTILINLGTVYQVYEGYCKLTKANSDFAKVANDKRGWDALPDAGLAHEICKKRLDIANLKWYKSAFDIADTTTKVILLVPTLYSVFVSPVGGFALTLTVEVISKGFGLAKQYTEDRSSALSEDLYNWRLDHDLTQEDLLSRAPQPPAPGV